MKLFFAMVEWDVFWFLYFKVTLGVSLFMGLIGLPRYYFERGQSEKPLMKLGEALRADLRDTALQMVGFAIPYIEVTILAYVFQSSNPWSQALMVALFLILFFYGMLCLVGQGVQILGAIIQQGISSIRIGLKGVLLKFYQKR